MWVRSNVRGREVAVFSLEDARVRYTGFFRRPFSPCKGIQAIQSWILNSTSRIPDSGFPVLDSCLSQWNLDSGFQSLVAFWISWAVFRIPKPRTPDSTANFSKIPNSTSKNFEDSGIQIPLHWATFLKNNRNILVVKCEKYKLGKS